MKEVQKSADMHIRQLREIQEEEKKRKEGKLVGKFAEMAKPFFEMGINLAKFSRMTKEQQMMHISQTTDEAER